MASSRTHRLALGILWLVQANGCLLPTVESSKQIASTDRADEATPGELDAGAVTTRARENEGGSTVGDAGPANETSVSDANASAVVDGGSAAPPEEAVPARRADASLASMLPSSAGKDGWNVVPGWSPQNHPTLEADLRRSILVIAEGGSDLKLEQTYGIRQGPAQDDPWIDIVEVRNVGTAERCDIAAIVTWPAGASTTYGGFSVRAYGSVRVKGTDAPVSSCLVPDEVGYFLIPEEANIARNPSITSMRLTMKSEVAVGYTTPNFRLVPAAFSVNTIKFVNTGSEPAPISYSNRVTHLIVAEDGTPLGAAEGSAGYGIRGPATVDPGAEVTYEMTKLTPRVVGDADRMLVLISKY